MKISRGLSQAYDVQDLAYNTLMALQAELGKNCLPGKICPPSKDDAAIIAQLGKVWRDAQEQIRIHRGKPLPGSLTHEKVKVARTRRAIVAASVAQCEHGVELSAVCVQCNAGGEAPAPGAQA